jgi:hypothetical protein
MKMEEKINSRKELRATQEYQRSSALGKILLENEHIPEAARYRNSFQRPLELIGLFGAPLYLDYLAKKGIVPPIENMTRIYVSELAGFVMGYDLGLVLGTLAYETFGKEGDIRQFFSKIKNSIDKKKKD